jgi:hypothetical protein
LLLGGNFNFNTHKCWPGDKIDCIWVVFKYCFTYNVPYCHDQGSHLSLRIDDFNLVREHGDSLEIRAGNSSEADLIGVYHYNNLTGTDLVKSDAFYLRLRATCSDNRHFRAIFATFTVPNSEGKCSYDDRQFACNNHRCIANTLKCDGIDHCGDGSDEQDCRLPTSPSRCTMYKMCLDGVGWYCPQEECNRKWDCVDGSDEHQDCWMTEASWPTTTPPGFSGYHWATFVPVGLVFFLMAIIVCIIISCCARRKRNAMLRRQRVQNSIMSGSSIPSGSETHLNINVEIQHYPDAPPSYDDAMRYDPRFGICNLGYTSSESADVLADVPPPYTPNPADPYPILHSVGVSQTAAASTTRQDISSVQPPRSREDSQHRRRHHSGSLSNRPRRPRRRGRSSRESPETNNQDTVPVSNAETDESQNTRLEETVNECPNRESSGSTGTSNDDTDITVSKPSTTAISESKGSNTRHKKGQSSGSGASLDGVCITENISKSEGDLANTDTNRLSKSQNDTSIEVLTQSAQDNSQITRNTSDGQHPADTIQADAMDLIQADAIEDRESDSEDVPASDGMSIHVTPTVHHSMPVSEEEDLHCEGAPDGASYV